MIHKVLQTTLIQVFIFILATINFGIQINYKSYVINDIVDDYSFSKNELDNNSPVMVLVQLDYDLSCCNFDYTKVSIKATDKDISKIIKDHRNKVKSYITSENNKIASSLSLSNYNVYISNCVPFIEISFENFIDYENDINSLLKSIAGKETIKDISIFNIDSMEVIRNINDSHTFLYPLSIAFSDIGVSNASYTGDGVKVGIIDNYVPDDLTIFNNTYINGNIEGSHATTTASIIGSSFGIAPDVTLYFNSDYYGSLGKKLDYFVYNYDVDIVNVSYGGLSTTQYDKYCAYYDKMSYLYNVCIVKSAGNNTNGTSNPGNALNIITVGSIDIFKNVSSFSGYVQNSSMLYKPEVVAPGENIYINYFDDPLSGTSYSTPMVSGIIALLMEEYPCLKCCPQLVKTVICGGCELLPSQTQYYETAKGFGLINYQNSRDYFINNCYSSFDILGNVFYEDLIATTSINLQSNNRIDINSCWETIADSNLDNDQFSYYYTTLLFKIYDNANSKFVKTTLLNSNLSFLSYTNPTNNTKNYTIYIYSASNKTTSIIENGYLTYKIEQQTHTHDYEYSTVPFSNSNHKCVCGCDDYIFEPHIIDLNGPGRFAICEKCGAVVDKNNFPFS